MDWIKSIYDAKNSEYQKSLNKGKNYLEYLEEQYRSNPEYRHYRKTINKYKNKKAYAEIY